MTKRQTRWFFIGGTTLFALIFLGMTIDSHRHFGTLTNADMITPDVIAGKDVWHAQNCINCHTLLGEGAYYAPDLTKITEQRGAPYLTAFLKDPSQFYSEEKHRRLMPNPNLNDEQIAQLISFLDWVSKIDNQGWPPRPILVSGGTFPGSHDTVGAEKDVAVSDAPVAQGQALFRNNPPGCASCHSTVEGVNLAGPSLAGIATQAERVLAGGDYKGKATTAEEFIRESILEPSAYLVPGAMYSAAGRSFMPDNYSDMLTPEQVEQLVAYLLSLR